MHQTQNNPRYPTLESIYLQHNDLVYSIALCAIQNTRDAEDVTLHTFRQAQNILDADPSGKHIASRLLEIVTTESLRTVSNRDNGIPYVSEQNHIYGNEHDDFMLPIEYTRQGELKGRLAQVIDSLPIYQRLALVMYVYNHLTIRATASALRCSENTALAHLCGAKATVKQQLEELAYRSGEYFNSAEMVPFDQVYSGLIASQAMSSQTASYIWDTLYHTADRDDRYAAPPGNAAEPPKGLSTGTKIALWLSATATVLVLAAVCAIIGFSPKASSKPSSAPQKETVVVVETTKSSSSSQTSSAPKDPKEPRQPQPERRPEKEPKDNSSSSSKSNSSSSSSSKKSSSGSSSSSSSSSSTASSKEDDLDETAILNLIAGTYNEQKTGSTDDFVTLTIQADKNISFYSLNYQTGGNSGYLYAKISSVGTKSKGVYTFTASDGDSPLSGSSFTYYSVGTSISELPFSSSFFETNGSTLTKAVIIDNRKTVYQ